MANLVNSRTSRYNANCPIEDGFIMEDDLMVWPQPTDTQVVVKVAEAGRLDMVASRIYQNPLLWWVLARRNGIIDQSTVKPGRILWVPTIQNTFSKGGVLGE